MRVGSDRLDGDLLEARLVASRLVDTALPRRDERTESLTQTSEPSHG